MDDPGSAGSTSHGARNHDRPLSSHRVWFARPRPKISIAHALAATFLAVVMAGGIWAGLRLWTLRDAYGKAMADVRVLEAYADRDPATLEREDLEHIRSRVDHLDRQLSRIDAATALPAGSGLVERIVWLGPRYREGREFVRMARLLSGAGRTASTVGIDVLDALDATGASADVAPAQPTWLDVLLARETELRAALADVAEAREVLEGIDPHYLPAGARERIDRIDHLLNRFDYATAADEYFPLARALLGADRPSRYLVLFQNPAELRPSGGFPGTMGLIEIDRGQLRSYEIFDAHYLSDIYISQQHPPRPQPWAIQTYFPSPSLVLHDASWWADFPRTGRTIYDMYHETGWPPIRGVVAVQPTLISALLRITGNVTITVDGEERLITPENVYDEIERLRRVFREGLGPDGRHKEVLELIGIELIERLKAADRGMLVNVVRAMQAAADVRDVQIYVDDAAAQRWLDERRWSGRVDIGDGVPTLALTLANVVTNKASQRLEPRVLLTLGPKVGQRRMVTLEMWLKNTGTNEEDPFYAGFSRWWVDIWMPPGSTRVTTHPAPMPDPEAPDGGSYLIAIFPQETGYLSVTFLTPEVDALRFRRQPGVVPLSIVIEDPVCSGRYTFDLTADTVAPFGSLCE